MTERSPPLPPMSIGIEAKVTNHDLTFFSNVRTKASDELQIVRPQYRDVKIG
jgi:hypothetical protein